MNRSNRPPNLERRPIEHILWQSIHRRTNLPSTLAFRSVGSFKISSPTVRKLHKFTSLDRSCHAIRSINDAQSHLRLQYSEHQKLMKPCPTTKKWKYGRALRSQVFEPLLFGYMDSAAPSDVLQRLIEKVRLGNVTSRLPFHKDVMRQEYCFRYG